MRFRGAVGAVVLTLAGAVDVQAATINVSKGGTDADSNCGVAPAPDCKTIAHAVGVRANDGDTVSIAPSPTPYDEGNIATTKAVSIVGAGDGVVLGGDGNGAHTTLKVTPAPSQRVSVSRLTFRSSASQSVAELIAGGPVDVSDVRFDSALAITARWQAEIFGTTTAAPSLRRAVFAGSSTGLGKALVVHGDKDGLRALAENVTTGSGYGDYVNNSVDIVTLEHADGSNLDVIADGRSGVRLDGAASLSDSRVLDGGGSGPVFGVTTSGQLAWPPPAPGVEQPVVTLRRNAVSTDTGLFVPLGGNTQVTLEGNRLGRPDSTSGILLPVAAVLTSTHDTVLGPVRGPNTVEPNAPTATFTNSYAKSVAPEVVCTSSGSVGSGCGMTPVADPGFVDAAAGDVHLRPDSPLIDRGSTNDPFPFELDGEARALDGDADGVIRSDAGYDEYAPAPDTIIDSGPGASQAGQAATFAFHSPTGGATFACALDGAASVPCDAGTFTSGPLAAGDHVFSVVATVGSRSDATPATRAFTIAGLPSAPGPSPTGPTGGAAGSADTGSSAARPVLRLVRVTPRRLRAGAVPARVKVTFTSSGPGTFSARLIRVLAKGRTKKLGPPATVRVARAGKAGIPLRKLVKRLGAGRYRVQLTGGRTTVNSGILRVS